MVSGNRVARTRERKADGEPRTPDGWLVNHPAIVLRAKRTVELLKRFGTTPQDTTRNSSCNISGYLGAAPAWALHDLFSFWP